MGRINDAYRLATWFLGDPVAAEDAVADAVLRAWERRRDLRDPGAADAWFGRILVNACRNELRRRARRPGVTLVEPTAGAEPDPAGVTADRDELARALARLTPDEQIVLALRYGRELTVPEIAGRTSVSDGTVKSRLHYALGHLRAEIDAGRR